MATPSPLNPLNPLNLLPPFSQPFYTTYGEAVPLRAQRAHPSEPEGALPPFYNYSLIFPFR